MACVLQVRWKTWVDQSGRSQPERADDSGSIFDERGHDVVKRPVSDHSRIIGSIPLLFPVLIDSLDGICTFPAIPLRPPEEPSVLAPDGPGPAVEAESIFTACPNFHRYVHSTTSPGTAFPEDFSPSIQSSVSTPISRQCHLSEVLRNCRSGVFFVYLLAFFSASLPLHLIWLCFPSPSPRRSFRNPAISY
ncbi:hypothetical protein BO78DRAFT_171051 [Aspergillus sclerotiicarbonarius CBS 121057]|uniref:Uncharacterized protein n=1 Tax=Aspergillus sclerotiicarbonarius (strain CBS 121057 / IBT 28362) TaxID=1448318 RepID=A0A319ETH4_ASPSB|nr:hypothetical protein BO78DRAFT_171051 [Aspergillus sclerotiicarbonarius CBS 121057]